MKLFVVTIDGPAGSGKSTTAREVARRLGYAHLDSGALYRAYTHAALELGLLRADGTLDTDQLEELLAAPIDAAVHDRELDVRHRGAPLRAELRSERVTSSVSQVAALPDVRRRVNEAVRQAARAYGRGVVCEGRDIGSAVFPDADLKVFLTADPEERARRRLKERGERITPDSVRDEARRLIERDRRDARRAASPFRRPEDALDLDNTDLSPDAQAARIVDWARARGAPEPELP